MKTTLSLGLLAGPVVLILASCSGATDDATTSQANAAGDAVEDAAGAILLSCDGSVGTKTNQQKYAVSLPEDVTAVEVEATGANGGGSGGGKGGSVSATIPAEASWGAQLYAKVGCQGSEGKTGWPNGGKGHGKAHPGGGSTSLDKNQITGTPLIIAGGGGGQDTGGHDQGGSVNGGDGTGGNGSGSKCGGGGATQSGAGSGGGKGSTKGDAGGKGSGGDGGQGRIRNGGGGGGGYYGGGGGCGGNYTSSGSGGAGSSWYDSTATDGTYGARDSGSSSGILKITFTCEAPGGETKSCSPTSAPTPVS